MPLLCVRLEYSHARLEQQLSRWRWWQRRASALCVAEALAQAASALPAACLVSAAVSLATS